MLALGMRWWVDTSALAPEVHDVLARLWSRASAAAGECGDAPAEAIFTLVPADAAEEPSEGHRVAVSTDRIPYGVSRALTLATLRRQRGTMLLLHAAGLTAPGVRRALVLVASSGTGKSTASHHLAQSWGYLSDESIGITDDLRVLGHPKPVSQLVDPGDLSHKVEASPDDAGYAVAPGSSELGAVVLLRRDPERTEPAALVAAPLLDSMLSAIGQTSSLYLLADPLDRLARAMTVGGGPWALDYRDIHDCDALLAGLLAEDAEDDAGVGVTWEHLPPSADRLAGVPGELVGEPPPPVPVPELDGTTRLRRGPWTDAIDTGDEALVLVGDRPYRLGGVGQALWLALAEPSTLDEVVAEVVDALGEHPDARDLTTNAVGQLVTTRLVEVVG